VLLAGRGLAQSFTHTGSAPLTLKALTRDEASQTSRAGGADGRQRQFAPTGYPYATPRPVRRQDFYPCLRPCPSRPDILPCQTYGTEPRGMGQPPGRRRRDFHPLTAGKPWQPEKSGLPRPYDGRTGFLKNLELTLGHGDLSGYGME
jgi:hypothetical protein